MADVSKRELVGINNAMPGPEAGAPRGYVILGAHSTWTSPPATLTIGPTDHGVAKETHDFMARGLALSNGSLEANVICDDGSSVACVINVETVC